MPAVSRRRAAIRAALSECPPHEWIAFDEFSRYMRAAGHRFVVSRDLWSLYIADAQYGSLGYSGYGGWHVVQGRYMLAYLFDSGPSPVNGTLPIRIEGCPNLLGN